MEWNKAESVLLAVLLCANLFLAGNLALQIAQGRTQQRQAMDQALELLHQDLGDFDETMFRAADGRRPVLAFNRSPEKERAAALALLGADQSDTEGGVSTFRSPQGELIFRTGGELRLNLALPPLEQDTPAFCRQLLEQAGFPMKDCLSWEEGDRVFFQQQTEGVKIQQCVLECATDGQSLEIQGRWLLADQALQVGDGSKGYQMAVALRAYLIQQDIRRPPSAVEEVYRLQDQGNGRLLAWPAWLVTAEGRQHLIGGENAEYGERS